MKQINEDYVSFEIAKLLKEKGFDERGLCVYTVEKERFYTFGDWVENSCLLPNLISAPTQSLVLKWLRLCYDIVIDISPNLTLNDVCKGSFMAEIYQYGHIVPEGEFGCNVGDDYTYEQAVEAALKYTLENLI